VVLGPLTPKVPNSDLNFHLMAHPLLVSFNGDSPSRRSQDQVDFQEYQETVGELYQKTPVFDKRAPVVMPDAAPLSHPMMYPHSKRKFQISSTPTPVVSSVSKNYYERGSKQTFKVGAGLLSLKEKSRSPSRAISP
jgi:hypothetical protein